MYPAWPRRGDDPVSGTPNLETVAALLQGVARAIDEMRDEQREIREELKSIRVVEVEHAHTSKELGRAFDSISKIEVDIKRIDGEIPERLAERLLAIEAHQPHHQLTSSLVMKAVFGLIALGAAGIWGAAIQRQMAPPPVVPAAHSQPAAVPAEPR